MVPRLHPYLNHRLGSIDTPAGRRVHWVGVKRGWFGLGYVAPVSLKKSQVAGVSHNLSTRVSLCEPAGHFRPLAQQTPKPRIRALAHSSTEHLGKPGVWMTEAGTSVWNFTIATRVNCRERGGIHYPVWRKLGFCVAQRPRQPLLCPTKLASQLRARYSVGAGTEKTPHTRDLPTPR